MENSIVVDFNALDRIAAKLDRAGNELNTAMSLLSGAQLSAAAGAQMRLNGGAITLRTAGVTVSAATVAQAIQSYRTALNRVGGYAGDLSAGVRAAANAFHMTESALAGGALPTQPDGGENLGSSGNERDRSSFGWDDIWELFLKLLPEAGFGGAIIGLFGQQLTGGTTAWPKRILQILSGGTKAAGGIAKGFSSSSSFDWKRLFSTYTDPDGTQKPSFSDALKKQFSKYSFANAEKVGDKIAVGCKWLGTALTVLTTGWDNYEEAGGQFTDRMLGETVIESGVKIGTGVLAGAAIAAILPVGAPAVLVGGLAVGVTWAVDKLSEALFDRNLAEMVSDTAMNLIENTQKGWETLKSDFQEAGNRIGNAVSSAGKAISGWWNGLFGKPAAAGGGAW